MENRESAEPMPFSSGPTPAHDRSPLEEESSFQLLVRLESDDEDAAKDLFDRYANRLAALAHQRLSGKMKRRVDADDIVQSVYRSFFRRAEENRFVLRRSGDLWRLLAAITVAKVKGQVEFHSAAKRSLSEEESQQHIVGYSVSADAVCNEPTPETASQLIEEFESLLAKQPEIHRSIIELAMQNLSIDEIAFDVCRSKRTVRRAIQQFRDDLENCLSQHIGGGGNSK